ncbi:MAG: hypothetical protein KM310_09545 [Clostridiales bacterium]|nr:hypothetical protein [Clostridiales bacterium]
MSRWTSTANRWIPSSPFIRHTVPANVAGFPALSIPFGLSKEGLPLGLQWMGPWEKERDLLRWAWAFSRLRE